MLVKLHGDELCHTVTCLMLHNKIEELFPATLNLATIGCQEDFQEYLMENYINLDQYVLQFY